MCRIVLKLQTRKALSLSLLGVALAAIIAIASVSGAGDFRRTPDYSADASKEVNLDELRSLLRQAHELEQTEKSAKTKSAAGSVPAKPGGDANADPAAAPKQADGDPKADGKDGSDEPVVEAEKPQATARAGCMYRGTTLIWEKLPGTCSP
jgi:hypothetical protein